MASKMLLYLSDEADTMLRDYEESHKKEGFELNKSSFISKAIIEKIQKLHKQTKEDVKKN